MPTLTTHWITAITGARWPGTGSCKCLPIPHVIGEAREHSC
ncbi:AGAP008628-PA [Anopheles gambiae str. PEST]|uniref:AGAP008628-PA n=1 Tax=Anopheles gambiae TaxID=7165 RepID=Q7PPL7_ANOGA|nr:AGAP008628-PA [Anopheles gambiae str. PEST]